MLLATFGIYAPRFTKVILDEWIRNLLLDNPGLTFTQLDRTRSLMDQVIPHCLVSGYESHIPGIALPDTSDRHVLAAAIESRAAVIVTFNLKDFRTLRLNRTISGQYTPIFFFLSFLTRTPVCSYEP
jgi:predicted nucleic acid-binding protein